jgi:hypothetical protein
MRNGLRSIVIESHGDEVHGDMPNFAIGHYDPSILCVKDDASCRHLKLRHFLGQLTVKVEIYSREVTNNLRRR